MKLALVLLGCLAFATAVPQERSSILINAQSLVKDIINKAQSDLDVIVTLVKELSTNSQNKVESIISSAKSQIATAVSVIESQISELLSKDETVATCAQKNAEELNGFKDAAEKTIDACAGTFTASAIALEADVVSQVLALKESVAQLIAIVDECSVNLAEVFTCVMEKGKEVQSIIESVIAQAANAVEIARVKADAAIVKIQDCTKHVVADSSIHINNLITAVAQCA